MASAWGDSWGDAWSDSWGQRTAPPVVVTVIDDDAGYAHPRRVHEQQQEARERAVNERADLRRVVARAVNGEPEKPDERRPDEAAVLTSQPAAAVPLMPPLGDLTASLGNIDAMLARLDQQRMAMQMEEEDVEAILLAA